MFPSSSPAFCLHIRPFESFKKVCLEYKQDIKNWRTPHGATLLHVLCGGGQEVVDVVDEVRKAEFLVNEMEVDVNAVTFTQGWTALHQACFFRESPGLAASLLALGANPLIQARDGRAPLHFALLHQNVELVKLLLSHPSQDKQVCLQDCLKRNPVLYCTLYGNKECLALLLRKGGEGTGST